jgi:hypothetical protein
MINVAVIIVVPQLAVRKSLKQNKAEKPKKAEKRKSKGFELDDVTYKAPEGVICLDEVQKAVNMHKFNAQAASAVENHEAEEIDSAIVEQLREYVAIVASSYQDNPFHNFAHACHVVS